MLRFNDPPRMPGTDKSPEELLARALPLAGTPGQAYAERRGVPLAVADAAGVRFDADFGGRPALVAPLNNRTGEITSVHGRYLRTVRGQGKMLTVGAGGGTINVLGGWHADPLILVEGLFDALSLAACGWSCIATIGRWAPWLSEVTNGRTVWLAFDAGRPGEADVARYGERLVGGDLRRLTPPPRCKDWNTALVKRGRDAVTRWVRDRIAVGGERLS
jgi:hypothetical protein